ncbi:hypothetical protein PFISCL1PPCAC_6535, partial [Pristionchus fissidentatus]
GTIISQRWILSAAHCFEEFVSITVFSLCTPQILIEELQPVISVMKAVFNHPNYTDDINDIALVKLREQLKFDESVSPVCLPNRNQPIPDDGLAIIVGF